MNLLLLDPGELTGAADGVVVLADRRARHLCTVLGVTVGQRLRAGLVGGALGDAEVIAVERADGDAPRVTVRFAAAAAVTPAAPPIDLVVAIPRPKVLPRLLENAAACAVRRIDLVNAWRVDKSYLDSPRLAPDAVALAVRLGAEQGVTTRLPEVVVHRRLMAYLDDALPAVHPPGARRLLAHPRDAVAVERAVPPGCVDPVVVALGPEGGWIARELDTFVARGFTAVHLGDAVLRTEAAVTAALAQLALLRRLPA
ncbi:MAG: RsmE family RNA methyltransferase [Kofleriaceae bacterium]|nr:RsmE family RNA methyltransferase [Kofleriaceae bacterium]